MRAEGDIVLAGVVGAGLVSRLLEEHRDKLEERFPASFLEQARVTARFVIDGEAFKEVLRSGPAGRSAFEMTGQGGIFAALWNLAEREKAGLVTAFDRIPIPQELIEICNYFDADPYTRDDCGSAVIAARDGRTLAEKLKEAGIPAYIIGEMNDTNARVVMRGATSCYLNKPERGTR